VDPRYASGFLVHSGWGGFAVPGGAFLAITGGEALYADMGHIGCNPIRTTWYGIVLPALLLNYVRWAACRRARSSKTIINGRGQWFLGRAT
jgi:K+ transporter